ICEAIRFFNHMKNVDTLIVGRGGGSIEELWSFNDEMVAREVFNSQIPIISAVGHETDFTICDFVSDMRAPTPSAAAEIATPSLDDINYKLGNIKSRMSKSLTNQIELDQYRLETVFNKINNYLDSYTIKDKVIQLDKIYDKIIFGIENNLKLEDEKLVKIGALLHNLSPLATMDRGYSITQKNGKVINSIKGLKIKDSIDIVLKDGNLECMIDKIENKEG
ncbi:exodeoxyribonuclease VII large subunit, partial [Clostridioides difficile]|nr:exodeoxyribonuclease VII large subunit [Clostridioides difficile]